MIPEKIGIFSSMLYRGWLPYEAEALGIYALRLHERGLLDEMFFLL
jgi:hypothetical protein